MTYWPKDFLCSFLMRFELP